MKTMHPATLFMGALAICFGTLAFSGTSNAQGFKTNSVLKSPSIQNQIEQQNQGAGAGAGSGLVRGAVSHFVVDDTYAWAVVGTTVYRLNRSDGGVTTIPLRVTPSQPLPPLIENPMKSGIRGLLKPPPGGGG